MKKLRFLLATLLALVLLPASSAAQTTENYQGIDYVEEGNAYYVYHTTAGVWADSVNSSTNRVALHIPNVINRKPVKGIYYLKTSVSLDIYVSDNTEYIGYFESSAINKSLDLYVKADNVEFNTSFNVSGGYTIKYYGEDIKSYTKYSSGYEPKVIARNGTMAYVKFSNDVGYVTGFYYFDATITSKGGGMVQLDNMGVSQFINTSGGTIHFKYESDQQSTYKVYAFCPTGKTAIIRKTDSESSSYVFRSGYSPKDGMTQYNFAVASIYPDRDNTTFEVIFVDDPITVHVANNGPGAVEFGALSSNNYGRTTTNIAPESSTDITSYVMDIAGLSSLSNLTVKVTYDKSAYTCKVTYNGASGRRELDLDTSNSGYDYATVAVVEDSECSITIDYYPIGSEVQVATGNIVFADNITKEICLNSWADGAGALSFTKAQTVSTLKVNGRRAFDSTPIVSFDELQFFTGLTALDGQAFLECGSLKSITLPRTLISIGNQAFYECKALTQIYLHEGLETIKDGAFQGSGLQALFIPKTVKTIGEGIVSSAQALTTISVDSRNPNYESPEGCNAIIKRSNRELVAGCKTTTIPETVRKIGARAFYGLEGLMSIEIPASVEEIGDNAFAECANLTSVVVRATNPPEMPSEERGYSDPAFEDIGEGCVLTVPKGKRQLYINAGWTEQTFRGGIVEASDDGATGSGYDVNGDGQVTISDVTKIVDVILKK